MMTRQLLQLKARASAFKEPVLWKNLLDVLMRAPASLLDKPILIYEDLDQHSKTVMQIRVIDPNDESDMDNFDPDVELNAPVMVLDRA